MFRRSVWPASNSQSCLYKLRVQVASITQSPRRSLPVATCKLQSEGNALGSQTLLASLIPFADSDFGLTRLPRSSLFYPLPSPSVRPSIRSSSFLYFIALPTRTAAHGSPHSPGNSRDEHFLISRSLGETRRALLFFAAKHIPCTVNAILAPCHHHARLRRRLRGARHSSATQKK